ncbi:hypothetical protein C7475_101175 [Chitinophaga sp. S165]|nr:hypothetical protein C7475_101175 [Chitinophaga sp. S165]
MLPDVPYVGCIALFDLRYVRFSEVFYDMLLKRRSRLMRDETYLFR